MGVDIKTTNAIYHLLLSFNPTKRSKLMPRRIRPLECLCGCGEMTRGGVFKPGHDARVMSELADEVGGVEGVAQILKDLGGVRRFWKVIREHQSFGGAV